MGKVVVVVVVSFRTFFKIFNFISFEIRIGWKKLALDQDVPREELLIATLWIPLLTIPLLWNYISLESLFRDIRIQATYILASSTVVNPSFFITLHLCSKMTLASKRKKDNLLLASASDKLRKRWIERWQCWRERAEKGKCQRTLLARRWRLAQFTINARSRCESRKRERERKKRNELCTTTVGPALRTLVRFKDLPSAPCSPPFSSIFP